MVRWLGGNMGTGYRYDKNGCLKVDDEYCCLEIADESGFDSGVAVIKDSGQRTEFESGAVRDMRTGKGRCDLVPLELIYMDYIELRMIRAYILDGDILHLHQCIKEYLDQKKCTACSLILEVSKHFEAGANKYGINNWQKGIPIWCYMDSAIRHYCKWKNGEEDEPHEQAYLWNIICAIWTHDNKPELRIADE